MTFGIIFLVLLSFFLGAAFGSFFGVLLDRIPRKESIVFPSSHCTNCGHKLSWYENIPVISYLVLGGRCKNCKSKIPFRFFLLEFAMGLLFAVISAVLISQIF